MKSANETLYWLGLLRDAKLVEEQKVIPILKEAEEISKMTGIALLTMKGKKKI